MMKERLMSQDKDRENTQQLQSQAKLTQVGKLIYY